MRSNIPQRSAASIAQAEHRLAAEGRMFLRGIRLLPPRAGMMAILITETALRPAAARRPPSLLFVGQRRDIGSEIAPP